MYVVDWCEAIRAMPEVDRPKLWFQNLKFQHCETCSVRDVHYRKSVGRAAASNRLLTFCVVTAVTAGGILLVGFVPAVARIPCPPGPVLYFRVLCSSSIVTCSIYVVCTSNTSYTTTRYYINTGICRV